MQLSLYMFYRHDYRYNGAQQLKAIMTLGEYKQLSKREQAIVLCERGVFLDLKHNADCNIILYQIDGFYVEVFYHHEGNVVKRLRSFKSTGKLRPYLEKMDIASLLAI
jgi:hypothetical protein